MQRKNKCKGKAMYSTYVSQNTDVVHMKFNYLLWDCVRDITLIKTLPKETANKNRRMVELQDSKQAQYIIILCYLLKPASAQGRAQILPTLCTVHCLMVYYQRPFSSIRVYARMREDRCGYDQWLSQSVNIQNDLGARESLYTSY